MSDFPRPFSSGKAKKQKKDTANKEHKIMDAGLFATAMKAPSKVKLQRDFDNAVKPVTQGVKEAVEFAGRTKEMGGPNMESPKQKRIKKRLDKRQAKVDESRATFGSKDPHLGKFDRRLNRLRRTVNQAENQGMNVSYDATDASGEGRKSSINMNYSPAKMESAKQEKYNLMHDMPVVKHASWMSKHSKSALHMGHKDSPAKKHCM